VNAKNTEANRSPVREQSRPAEFNAIIAAYGNARPSLEQPALSFWGPLAEQGNAIGRYNYSILESKALDTFAGLEYESCCWAIRTFWQRSVTSTSGEYDSAVAIQFEMKGFSNVGTGSMAGLKRDILGDWIR